MAATADTSSPAAWKSPRDRDTKTVTMALVAGGFQTPKVAITAPGSVMIATPTGATAEVDARPGDEFFLVRRCASPAAVATLVISRDGKMWRTSSVDAVSFELTARQDFGVNTLPATVDSRLFFDVIDVGKKNEMGVPNLAASGLSFR